MADTNRINDIEKTLFGGKIKTDFISAPHTTINNEQGQPRQIPDLENNLKISMGIERVMFNSIKGLDKEFGPNGEPAYELSNKDARFRFVGAGIQGQSTNDGTHIRLTLENDFAEITFYGTGLNIVTQRRDFNDQLFPTIDGGAEGADLQPTVSGILKNRDYSTNQVTNVASGLSLGIHTIKLRSGNVTDTLFYGVEILNENASAQLTANAGEPFVGGFAAKLTSQQILDAAPSSYLGSKGARVVTYLDEEGSIGQAITDVDASAAYLASASHVNEEIARTINYREFGADKSDDFSTLVGSSDRTFTLDDGTTNLTGSDVASETGGITTPMDSGVYLLANSTSFLILTFTGTGLDVKWAGADNGTNAAANTYEVFVNGVSVGNWDTVESSAGTPKNKRICSGLPYGTHTVRIQRNTASFWGLGIRDFIVYQSKKPTIPDTSFELADYNIMADYVVSAGAGLDTMGTGLLRKFGARENVYTGTWGVDYLSGSAVSEYISGIQWFDASSTTGSFERTFYGTGLELRFKAFSSYNANARFRLNGVLLTAANFPTATFADYGLDSGYDTANGTLDYRNAASQRGAGFSVSGLPLGHYTLEVDKNGSSSTFSVEAIDIITPIHINNTKVGSLSLEDKRKDQQIAGDARSIDLSKAKAWLQYDGVNNVVLDSYNVSAVLDISTGYHVIYLKKGFKDKKYVTLPVAEDDPTSNTMRMQTREKEKNSFKVINTTDSGAATDGIINVVCFGELENEEDIDLGDL